MAAILRLQEVKKNFGGVMAVDGLSMQIQAGQVCGLIGPNGAGKTTVFNLITGVHRCQQGSIFFEGREITSAKPFRITRLGVARTFQTIRLFPNFSTFEHVRVAQTCLSASGRMKSLGGERSLGGRLQKEAADLLSLLGLWDARNQKAITLPYGSQGKVEIARALATRPRLLLLDEPVAGMNGRETEELLLIISKIREMGITILLIDHDMKFVMGLCDRLWVLNFGRKIAEGTPREIQRNDSVLEAYLGREG
ncbi:MAG: ABC transporter ATP-binding protein [Desulfobacterales bacterium]|nr:ABC transporter ATP-binding protein [Desulfobacterales bacterium]